MEGTPPVSLLISFRAFLNRVAEAQLARLYALADPSGARIHRNILEFTKSGRCLELVRDFRGLVLRPTGVDPLDHLPPHPLEELQGVLLRGFPRADSIPRTMELLAEILVTDSRHTRSIPVVEVVRVLKLAFSQEKEWESQDALTPVASGLAPFEIVRMRDEVLAVVQEKIVTTYLAHGKLDRDQARRIGLAFRDLLNDWANGDGQERSLQEYLSGHLSLEEKEYTGTYRVKMEYLHKIARSAFAARLMKEL